MRKSLMWVPVVVFLALGVGCSGKEEEEEEEAAGERTSPGRASATAPKLEACDLVTLADAQAVYGPAMTVVPQRTSTDTGPGAVVSNCLYSTDDTPMKALNILLRTSLVGEDDLGNLDRFIQKTTEALGDEFKYERVDGLPAPAAWQPTGPSSGTLFAFLGTRHISINADTVQGKTAKEVAEGMMAKALERLGAKK